MENYHENRPAISDPALVIELGESVAEAMQPPKPVVSLGEMAITALSEVASQDRTTPTE